MLSEPTDNTRMEIGGLCIAWSFLEAQSEQTLWGILEADLPLAAIITDRLDLRLRWEMILKYAPKKHSIDETAELRRINKLITSKTADRNIIVHGAMHALLERTYKAPYGTIVDKRDPNLISEKRVACWTVFKGAAAYKNFPVSSEAVKIVSLNIQKISEQVVKFNRQHGYHGKARAEAPVETGWPEPI
jgi:hypothetical protein